MPSFTEAKNAQIIPFPLRGRVATMTPSQLKLMRLEQESRAFSGVDHGAWYHAEAIEDGAEVQEPGRGH